MTDEKWAVIVEQLRQQNERFETLAKEQTESRVETAEIRSDLRAVRDDLKRLVKKFDSGNGMSTKLTRAEDTVDRIRDDLDSCRQRCARYWRIVITGLIIPSLLYVGYRIVDHIIK